MNGTKRSHYLLVVDENQGAQISRIKTDTPISLEEKCGRFLVILILGLITGAFIVGPYFMSLPR